MQHHRCAQKGQLWYIRASHVLSNGAGQHPWPVLQKAVIVPTTLCAVWPLQAIIHGEFVHEAVVAALAEKPWPLLAAILAEQHQVLADRGSGTRHLMRKLAAVAGELCVIHCRGCALWVPVSFSHALARQGSPHAP